MAAAGFAACMGGPYHFLPPCLSSRADQIPAPPKIILQAAEIGIEHNLGLTCDPIDGLVQVPCIVRLSLLFLPSTPQPARANPLTATIQERNSLGAVKAVTAAQLAMATDAVHSVTLDEAIEAMRLTAAGQFIY